jgi:hypothetical protein
MLSTNSESAAGTFKSSETNPADLPNSRSPGGNLGVSVAVTPKISLNLSASSSADSVARPAAVGFSPRAAKSSDTLSTPFGFRHSLRRRIWSLIDALGVANSVVKILAQLKVDATAECSVKVYHGRHKTVAEKQPQIDFLQTGMSAFVPRHGIAPDRARALSAPPGFGFGFGAISR